MNFVFFLISLIININIVESKRKSWTVAEELGLNNRLTSIYLSFLTYKHHKNSDILRFTEKQLQFC